MVDQLPLKIESLGIDHWTQELIKGGVNPWTGDKAKVLGGGFYGGMNAQAANLQVINDYLVYGFDACRIDTATGQALVDAARDFYGPDEMVKKSGESDDSYRARIKAGLFIPYATKDAFIRAITALTGVVPRLIEGWLPQETSAYDWSYYDVDIPDRPGLYGDSNLPYQAFVIATLPSPSGEEQATAIWGYDAGAAYDLYTGVYWNLKAANFITQFDLDQLILRIKAFGITIWRKYESIGALPFPIPQSFAVATNQYYFPINIQQYASQFIVIVSGNWNSQYSVSNITLNGFVINTSAATPSGSTLSYVIIPLTQPEIVEGSGFVPLDDGDTTAVIPAPVAPATPGNRGMVTPSWNTTVWIDSIIDGAINVEMSTPAPIGATLSYYFFPPTQSALQYLSDDDIATGKTFVSVPGIPPSCAFAMPSWNTDVAVEVVPGGISVDFGSGAPVGAFIQWGYFILNGA